MMLMPRTDILKFCYFLFVHVFFVLVRQMKHALFLWSTSSTYLLFLWSIHGNSAHTCSKKFAKCRINANFPYQFYHVSVIKFQPLYELQTPHNQLQGSRSQNCTKSTLIILRQCMLTFNITLTFFRFFTSMPF